MSDIADIILAWIALGILGASLVVSIALGAAIHRMMRDEGGP